MTQPEWRIDEKSSGTHNRVVVDIKDPNTVVAILEFKPTVPAERVRSSALLMAASPKLEAACEAVCEYINGSFQDDIECDAVEVQRCMDILREKCHAALFFASNGKMPDPPITVTQAFARGVSDGIAQHPNFTTGITYPCPELNEAYDKGVNLGQHICNGGQVQPRKDTIEPEVERVVILQRRSALDNDGEYKGIYMTNVQRHTLSNWIKINNNLYEVFKRQHHADAMLSFWEVILPQNAELPTPLLEQLNPLAEEQELVVAARKLLCIMEQRQNTFVGDLPPVFMEKLRKALPPNPFIDEA